MPNQYTHFDVFMTANYAVSFDFIALFKYSLIDEH